MLDLLFILYAVIGVMCSKVVNVIKPSDMPWSGTFLYLQGVCFYFCVLSLSWAVSYAFFLSNSVICSEDQICPRKHLESHSVFQERVLKPQTCQGCGQQLPLPGSIPYHRLSFQLTGTVLQFLCGCIPCRMHTGRQVCCTGGVPSPLPCTS